MSGARLLRGRACPQVAHAKEWPIRFRDGTALALTAPNASRPYGAKSGRPRAAGASVPTCVRNRVESLAAPWSHPQRCLGPGHMPVTASTRSRPPAWRPRTALYPDITLLLRVESRSHHCSTQVIGEMFTGIRPARPHRRHRRPPRGPRHSRGEQLPGHGPPARRRRHLPRVAPQDGAPAPAQGLGRRYGSASAECHARRRLAPTTWARPHAVAAATTRPSGENQSTPPSISLVHHALAGKKGS